MTKEGCIHVRVVNFRDEGLWLRPGIHVGVAHSPGHLQHQVNKVETSVDEAEITLCTNRNSTNQTKYVSNGLTD